MGSLTLSGEWMGQGWRWREQEERSEWELGLGCKMKKDYLKKKENYVGDVHVSVCVSMFVYVCVRAHIHIGEQEVNIRCFP